MIFIALGCLIVFLNASKIDFKRYETLSNLQEDYNLTDEEGRWNVWKRGMNFMLSNPFTGVGVGSFNAAIGLDRKERGVGRAYWQTAHNSLVQIGAETGVLGFILFGLMSFNAFRIFSKVRKNARIEALVRIGEMARVGFSGLFITSMFLSQAYSVYWAFYIALSAILEDCLDKGRREMAYVRK
jgi:O-antigen ligase